MQTDESQSDSRLPAGTQIESSTGWLLACGFFILAAVLWMMSGGVSTPKASTPSFDAALISQQSMRDAPQDPPIAVIAGFEQRCNSCHQLFQSEWDGSRPLQQHTHVALNHGINNECNNCHDQEDRESLILHDGASVPFVETAQLCAQCHGPVFRDWERGTHGKTVGSWDLSSDAARKLSCIECHDPHSPAYDKVHLLPGPNTLRMGDPASRPTHHDNRNPLRRWNHVENTEGGH
jgi:hypothetical protein